MTHRAGLVLALVRLLSAASGEAASTPRPPQASLSVSKKASAHSCPSEKELRRDVTAILGYAPFHTGAHRRVTAVLWATEGTFHARIQLLDARTHHSLGNRELSAAGPTCEALSSAMALAIALAIDPLAQPPPPRKPAASPPLAAVAAPVPARAPRPSATAAVVASAAGASSDVGQQARPAPALSEPPVFAVAVPDAGAPEAAGPVAVAEADAGPAADAGTVSAALLAPAAPAAADGGTPVEAVAALPAVPPVPAAASASSTAAAPEGGFHGLVGAGADVTFGLVPSTAFGLVVHGGVAWTFASAELEVRWLPNTSLGFEGGTISSRLLTGALVGCATFKSFGSFGACGLFETGPLTSQGHGYSQSFSSTTWTAALGVRGHWDWVFAHPLGLRVHVDGLVNVVRTRLLVGPDVAWQAPSVALDVGVGLFLVF
jgi:hypothetical protein